MPKFKVTTNTGSNFYLKDENEIHRGGEGRILLIDSQKEKVAAWNQFKLTIFLNKIGDLHPHKNRLTIITANIKGVSAARQGRLFQTGVTPVSARLANHR